MKVVGLLLLFRIIEMNHCHVGRQDFRTSYYIAVRASVPTSHINRLSQYNLDPRTKHLGEGEFSQSVINDMNLLSKLSLEMGVYRGA